MSERRRLTLALDFEVVTEPSGEFHDLVSMEVIDDGQVDTDSLVDFLSNWDKDYIIEMFSTVLATGLWKDEQ